MKIKLFSLLMLMSISIINASDGSKSPATVEIIEISRPSSAPASTDEVKMPPQEPRSSSAPVNACQQHPQIRRLLKENKMLKNLLMTKWQS